jgi:RHS repeat-associated protein
MYDEEDRKMSFTYDEYGKKLSETDQANNTKKYKYNADSQLTKTAMPNGTSVAYAYDHNGNTTEKLITANGKTQKVTYEYDVDNKPTVVKDALGRTVTNTYDANANLTSIKTPNGNVVELTYDAANRLTESKQDGKRAFGFHYDANGNETKVIDAVNNITRDKVYDVGNRITSMTDRNGTVAWSYYDKTHELKETKINHGSYQNTTSYVYDVLNQNTEVKDRDKIYCFDYDEYGNVRTYTTGNGVGTAFHYDHTKKIDLLSIGDQQGNSLLYETYKYDANSNRTNTTHTKDGKTEEIAYKYDSINQLTEEKLADGTTKKYTYDGFGNRTSVQVGSKTTTAEFNAGNQLTKYGEEALTYDANGNRTSDGKYTYTWNAIDQLTAVTKKGESTPFATYKYDDDNRRIEKVVNGNVTRYFYDGDSINPLYETDGNGNVLRQYVYSSGNLRLAMKTQGQTFYYHYNSHGDVVAMTDQQGKVVASYEYDAWGNVLKSEATGPAADNPFGYAGYMYDKEIGMYYLIARYYQPKHGVFISVDPDSGDDDDPLTQNGYTYAGNNPVMHVDPDGNWFWAVVNVFTAAKKGYDTYKSGGSWGDVAKAVATEVVSAPLRGYKAVKQVANWVWKKPKPKKAPMRGVDLQLFAAKGRATNKLKPNLSAKGAHSVYKRGANGKITNYETYKPQTNRNNPHAWIKIKRYDGVGAPHYDKKRKISFTVPHVHTYNKKGRESVRYPRSKERPR